MSESKKVKITNKRTGEVSSAKTARSAMQRKDEKQVPKEHVEGGKAEQVVVEKDSLSPEQKEDSSVPTEKASSLTKSAKKKSPKVEIKCLADYIAYAYSRKGQVLKTLAPGEIKAINKNARLSESQFEELLAVAKGDSLLAVPRQIVLTVQEIDGPPLIRQEVRRLISEVLKQHPVYQQNNLVPVIANLEEASEPVEAIQTIAKLSQESLASLTGLEKPKPKDSETLRSNAINCLALWLWESRGQQINRVIRWLHDGYWSLVAPSDAKSTASLQAITGITEIASVGKACQQFKSEADDNSLRASGLEAKIDSLLSEIQGLRQTIGDLKGDVKERDDTIKQLSDELDAERSAHANSRVHLGDDREHLRSNVVRRLKREVSLLTEGLQALRKDPPKVRVMDDHAERVLEGFQTAIRELEEED